MPITRVYVTRAISEEALSVIRKSAEINIWQQNCPVSDDILRQEIPDADGLLCMLNDSIDADLIRSAPRLKVISTMAVGYDNIDIAAATKQGIVVGHTPGVLTETSADLAFALLMASARRIAEADRKVRKGFWEPWGPMVMAGYDIHRRTLGIIGLGRIGRAMAHRATGFSMRVLYHSPNRKKEAERELGVEYRQELTDLLAESDFVSMHCPLTDATRKLIGAKELAAMKKTGILINTSRGTVVDQQALYEALASGTIAAAGIDVSETEPICPNDPLLGLDNIVITPHIASASVATRTRMAQVATENLLAGLAGKVPLYCVNPEALEHRKKHTD